MKRSLIRNDPCLGCPETPASAAAPSLMQLSPLEGTASFLIPALLFQSTPRHSAGVGTPRLQLLGAGRDELDQVGGLIWWTQKSTGCLCKTGKSRL